MNQYDFLIIGSGIAGLSYALKVNQLLPNARIAIVTKADENESNTKYAQGGIAVVIDEIADSYKQHIEDTLVAGDGLCNKKVVEFVVKEGPERFNELVNWGANFDKDNQGNYNLGLEGGHSQNRILHHKDITGFEIEQSLIKNIKASNNINILSQHLAIDLITEHHIKPDKNKNTKCYGAYIFNDLTKEVNTCLSKITMLATGGIGQVYNNTTNPTVATGDGIAMAYRAKAQIKDMEFIQFHPTALYYPEEKPAFLISEAVRGFGALLRNKSGELFMEKYDSRKELAPRDIVSRAIDNELKIRGDEYVYLDCRHLNLDEFKAHFPNILDKVSSLGIDINKDMIPVVAAAHYLCGGVAVNEYGQTSIKNLYACGECSHTGLHGANRLASNSLLEALVFAHRCAENSTSLISETKALDLAPDWNDKGTSIPKEQILITHSLKELQNLMSDFVGIVKNEERLNNASERLSLLYNETELLYKKSSISFKLIELRNLITVAYLIVQQSKKRKENRGVFYKTT